MEKGDVFVCVPKGRDNAKSVEEIWEFYLHISKLEIEGNKKPSSQFRQFISALSKDGYVFKILNEDFSPKEVGKYGVDFRKKLYFTPLPSDVDLSNARRKEMLFLADVEDEIRKRRERNKIEEEEKRRQEKREWGKVKQLIDLWLKQLPKHSSEYPHALYANENHFIPELIPSELSVTGVNDEGELAEFSANQNDPVPYFGQPLKIEGIENLWEYAQNKFPQIYNNYVRMKTKAQECKKELDDELSSIRDESKNELDLVFQVGDRDDLKNRRLEEIQDHEERLVYKLMIGCYDDIVTGLLADIRQRLKDERKEIEETISIL